MTTKNIERYFDVINRSLATICGKLDYQRITCAITKLANELAATDTDENIWYIGEHGEFCLSDLIIGAYWHFTEWHGGQYSAEYAALSSLSGIFNPGFSNGPDPDSSEFFVYQELENMAQEAQK